MKRFLLIFLIACAPGCSPGPEHKLRLADVTLDYLIAGNGPPIYLLHGGMESRDSFSEQIPALAEHFTVVALDSREQGRSTKSERQITYELMAQDVAALAKHLGHDKFSIIGHSDGGVVALTTAIRYPDMVEKMVLIETVYHYEAYPAETRNYIANYEWDGNEDRAQFPGMFIDDYLKGQKDLSQFGATLAELAIMWTTTPTFSMSDLASVKAAALIINGSLDDTTLGHVESLRAGLPDARLEVVTGAAHHPHQEEPKLVNNAILAFLSQ